MRRERIATKALAANAGRPAPTAASRQQALQPVSSTVRTLSVEIAANSHSKGPMSAIFDQSGVRFAYPESWTIENPPDEEAEVQVTASSEGTAFWSLSVYPGLRDIRGLLGEVLQAMQAEYPALEHDPADEIVEGTSVVGYDLSFYCLDLTNSAWIRVFHRNQATYLLLAQAEDKEFEEVEPVFEAMTACLLRPELIKPLE